MLRGAVISRGTGRAELSIEWTGLRSRNDKGPVDYVLGSRRPSSSVKRPVSMKVVSMKGSRREISDEARRT